MRLILLLRRLLRGTEHDRARDWHARFENQKDARARHRRIAFLEATRAMSGNAHVLLGRAEDESGGFQWCGLPPHALTGQHLGVVGATGTGKSYLLAALLYQLLEAGVPVILLDMKSELVGVVLDTLVPALVARGREDLVSQIRRIDPFARDRVPLLRLTQPEPGISIQVQALNLTSALEEAIGQDHGVRMQRALLPAAGLCIERNAPLPMILEWLRDPRRFAREAATSSDPVIRAYAIHELPRENRSSLDALRARLDLLFHLPEVRRALSAPRCIDLHECLDGGITAMDFGSPPGGAESAMRFLAGPLMGRLSRAILSRHLREDSPQAVVVFEEFQELLGRHQVEQFERLLALCRFKRVGLWFSNQQPAQIASVDRTLLRVLRTNLGAEIIFRSSPEDAKALSETLSTRSEGESLAQARARFIEEVASLPRRQFLLWLKADSFGPQLLRSPRLDMDALRRAGDQLPAETRQRITTGCASVALSEVEEVISDHDDEDEGPRITPLPPRPRPRTPRLG